MAALEDLIAIVTLDDLGADRFRGGGSRNDGVDATYGGHFLGQAVTAACATVEPDRRIHSLHSYFLRAGRPGQPFVLTVDRVRDGRSFCTRRVVVTQALDPDADPSWGQEPGQPLFELLASFARPEDGPVSNPDPPPYFDSLPHPDELLTHHQLMTQLDPLPLPEAWALRDYGLDLRTVAAPWAPTGPSEQGGIQLWVKADGQLPEDPALHAAILAYQSDESLADNIAIPWGATWGSEGVVFVSLDHAIWFHRPIDWNHWHFIDQQAVTVGQGRGVASAKVWTSDGELVATFTQEALLRLTPDLMAAHHG